VKIYDISVPVHQDMPVWPGDPGVRLVRTGSMADGDPYNNSRLEMGSHTGTHVDAPFHFIQNGITVDKLSLDVLIGPAAVVGVETEPAITADVLERLSIKKGISRLLFKTSNSAPGGPWSKSGFQPDFVHIAPDGARWLVERGLRLVGIDYLSVEKYGALEPDTHHTLLGAGVVVVEGLNLANVPPGEYTLVCLPLMVAEGDGAPARIVLLGD